MSVTHQIWVDLRVRVTSTSTAISITGVRHYDGTNGGSAYSAVGIQGIAHPTVELIAEASESQARLSIMDSS